MIARRIQDILDFRYHRRRFTVILLMMHAAVKANGPISGRNLNRRINVRK